MTGRRIDWRSSSGLVEFELRPKSLDGVRREDSVWAMQHLVYAFKYRDPGARHAALAIYARLTGMREDLHQSPAYDFDTGAPGAQAVGDELLRAARAGVVVARRHVTRSVVLRVDAVEESVLGPESASTLDWLEIKVVDSEGKPVPNVLYSVTTPDNRTQQGRVDQAGFARLEGLTAGKCTVTFPELDRPVIQPA